MRCDAGRGALWEASHLAAHASMSGMASITMPATAPHPAVVPKVGTVVSCVLHGVAGEGGAHELLLHLAARSYPGARSQAHLVSTRKRRNAQ
jgi:hypothetical protein